MSWVRDVALGGRLSVHTASCSAALLNAAQASIRGREIRPFSVSALFYMATAIDQWWGEGGSAARDHPVYCRLIGWLV